jgi:two-component system, sporulation sensor kinase E
MRRAHCSHQYLVQNLVQRFSTIRGLLLRYGAALLCVGVAVGVRHALTPVVGDSAAPFATITAAIMLIAWLAGTGPAVMATIVGLMAANRYFLEPTYAIQSNVRNVNIVHIAAYLVVSGSAILMSAAFRRSLAKYERELQRREEVEHDLNREQDVLRETEEKFRAVAETAGSAIFIHDGSRLLYVNPAIVELSGYSREELLSSDIWRLLHPDYRNLLKERAAARLRGEAPPSRYEFKIITKTGEERWLDSSARLIAFEGRRCILAVAFDVTDRKRAEETLRNREEHYRAAIEAGKIGTWELDIAQSDVFLSDRIYERNGIKKTTPCVKFEQWLEAVHEDDRPRINAAIKSALERDELEVDFRVVQQGTNDIRWVVAAGRLLRDDAGSPLRILGASVDVTELRRSEEALRNREEHYRAAIDVGKIGTWEWEIAQNRVIISDKIYDFTGIEKAASHVTLEEWMEPVHKDDRPRVESAMRSALERDAKYEAEFRVVEQGTNEVRWVAASGRVLMDNAGKPLRMLGAAVDVTERRRSEEALRNSEKLAATGRLAASIAHELNNPLETLTNLIFLARTAGGVNSQGDRFLAMAEEELKWAAHLTKQTLGFYRDSTFPKRFDVAQALDDVLSLYARKIESKGAHVCKEYSGSTQMLGLTGEIRQMISNLLANAVDALPSKGGMLRLRIRSIANWNGTGKALRITIADTGVGIPCEMRKHIFEPFFTTKPDTGTGLGLWLTKNIVEKHQGTIRFASSNVGRTGTVFVLTLPQEQRESAIGNAAA